ncbi:MAG: 5'-nucleotidase C-terminal domain-containing protein, partial [Bacillota bacterium]
VADGRSEVRRVQEDTPSSEMVEDIARDIHEKTVEYVRTPIGETERRINSFFARVSDSSITQIVNEAQLWYAEQELDADVPVLSAAAPFIAGREGPDYFTHVEGDVNIGDVTDMYIYPNTVYVMRLNGQQVIDWLERSAENFNQIDPDSAETQHLVNYEMPAYNYDVIEGIEYAFDVTQPEGERVAEATYNGEPLTEDMEFLVITNNYRGSGGGEFPHMTEENLELATTDINRQQIIRYIEEKGTVNPVPTDNWRIRPVDVEGQIIYRSSPEAADYLDELNLNNIKYLETDEDGWGIYEIDLSN